MRDLSRNENGFSLKKFLLSMALIIALVAPDTLGVAASDFSAEPERIGDQDLFSQEERVEEAVKTQDRPVGAVETGEVREVSEGLSDFLSAAPDEEAGFRQFSVKEGNHKVRVLFDENSELPAKALLIERDNLKKENETNEDLKNQQNSGREKILEKAEAVLGYQGSELFFAKAFDLVLSDNNKKTAYHTPVDPIKVEICFYAPDILEKAGKKDTLENREKLLKKLSLGKMQVVRLISAEEEENARRDPKLNGQLPLSWKVFEDEELGRFVYEIPEVSVEKDKLSFRAGCLSPFALICRTENEDEQMLSADFDGGLEMFAKVNPDIAEETETTEAADETEETETTEAADKTEELKITEAADETEEAEATEAADETEEPETAEATEHTEESGTTEAADETEETETTEAADETEETETTEAADEAEESETVEATEHPEETETTVDPDLEKESGAIEDFDLSEASEATDISETTDNNQLSSTGDNYEISVTYDQEANIPEGAALSVSEIAEDTSKYDALMAQAVNVLEGDAENVVSVKLVDLSIEKDGETVEPEAPVDVTLQVAQQDNQAVETQVVSVNRQAELLEAVDHESEEHAIYESAGQTLDTVYAIIERSLTKELVSSDGNTYEVTVTFGKDAQIPTGAVLEIREIPEDSKEYEAYLQQTAETLNKDSGAISYARLLDISIVKDGEEVEIGASVDVQIRLKDKVSSEAGEELSVVHFAEKPEVMSAGTEYEEDGEVIRFETGSFSVYAVVYTVETYYIDSEGETWKITATYGPETGLPADVELVVRELGAEESEGYLADTAAALGKEEKAVKIAKAFDITFEKDGIAYHKLGGDVAITIELLDQETSDTMEVVHFGDTTERVESETAGNTVSFSSDEFSVYVVSTDVLVRTYTFMNGSDVYSKQVLKSRENLIEPPMPSKANAVFSHWSTSADGSAVVEFDYYTPETINKAQVIAKVAAEQSKDESEVTDEEITAWVAAHPITIDESAIRTAVAAEKEITEAEVTKADMQAWLEAHPVTFYATYGSEKIHITYYDQNGSVYRREEYDRPTGEGFQDVDTNEVDYTPIQNKKDVYQLFAYWTAGAVSGSASSALPKVGTNGTIRLDKHSKDYALFPVLEEGHWIYFDTNTSSVNDDSAWASYVAPMFVKNGEDTTSITADVPKMQGYIFKGWYLSRGGDDQVFDASGNKVTGTTENPAGYDLLLNRNGDLANDPTLFAHWQKEATADYTVVVWKQKLTADGKQASSEYAFAESHKYTNVSTATNAAIDNSFSQLGGSGEYVGFHYNNTKSDTSVVVKPDGSTIANVYYDRNVHTFTFNTGYSSNNSGLYYRGGSGTNNSPYFGIRIHRSGNSRYYYTYTDISTSTTQYYNGTLYKKVDGRYVEETSYNPGTTYYGIAEGYVALTRGTVNASYNATTVKTITAPYGAKIIDEFPIKGSNGTTYNYTWLPSGSAKYNITLMSVQTMPDVDIVFTGSNSGTAKHMVYCLERSNDASEVTVNTKQEANTSVTPAKGSIVSYNGKEYYVYLDQRHNYSYLDFNVDMSPVDGYYRCSDDLSGVTLAKPDIPGTETSLPAFTQNGSSQYIINNPPTNVYYFYRRQPYTLTFYDAYKDETVATATQLDTTSAKFKDSLEAYANAVTLPTHNGFSFNGWYMDEICSTRVFFHEPNQAEKNSTKDYNGNYHYDVIERMPSNNLVLYAGWEKLNYRVEIDPNGGEIGKPINDYSTYFWVDYGELISPYDEIKRDYVKVSTGGEYVYKVFRYDSQPNEDPNVASTLSANWKRTALYKEAGEGETGEYIHKPGAYTFLGWYKVKADGTMESHPYNFRNTVEQDLKLRAKWRRSGGYTVVYDGGDGITVPVDKSEYIENAQAVVMGALGAPKGKTLDYWKDSKNNHYKPNELLSIAEDLAVEQNDGSMRITLTAVYRDLDPNENIMADYIFMSDGAVYYKQTIMAGEELVVPKTPEKTGKVFEGWYYDTAFTKPFNGFGVIDVPVYTTLYACFENRYTVEYYLTNMDGTKTNSLIASQVYTEGQSLNTIGIEHPVDADHTVEYWKKADGTGKYPYKSITNIGVTENLVLIAHLAKQITLYFDSQHGTPVNPVAVDDDAWPIRPVEPTRKGYTFKGWYTQKTGGVAYDFRHTLAELKVMDSSWEDQDHPTLYAQWELNTANPTKGQVNIIWWAQTADRPEDDDEAAADKDAYQMIYNQVVNANYGTWSAETMNTGLQSYFHMWEINSVCDFAINRQGQQTARTFCENILSASDAATLQQLNNYYKVNKTKSDASVVVDDTGDGCLNVYFDLTTYTFEFDTTKETDKQSTGNKAEIYDAEGNVYTGKDYKLTVWLNKSIGNDWPSVRDAGSGKARVKWTADTTHVINGWYEPKVGNLASKNYFTVPPSADKDKIDKAIRGEGTLTYTLYPASKNTYSGVAVIHAMYLNDEGVYVEIPELMEEKAVIPKGSNSYYGTQPSPCGMSYYDRVGPKDQDGYEIVTDLNGEPTFNGSMINHNPATGSNNFISSVVSTEPSVTVTKYKYMISDEWASAVFYNSESTNERLTLTNIPSETRDDGYSSNPTYTVTYGSGIEKTGGRVYYRVRHQGWLVSWTTWESMSWDEFINDVIVKDSKTVTESVGNGTNLYFYYRPLKYALSLYTDANTPWRNQPGNISYNKQLSGPNGLLKDYQIDPDNAQDQAIIPEGYRFAGWSAAPGSNQEFRGTMPNHNLTLYAIWEKVSVKVTALYCQDDGTYVPSAEGDENAVYTEYTGAYGTSLQSFNIPNAKADGKMFLGWVDASTDKAISKNTVVKSDLYIYPEWVSTESWKVTYDAGEGTGTVPNDAKDYLAGSSAVVLGGDGLTADKKDIRGNDYTAKFSYWTDENGKEYYPGDKIDITKNSPNPIKLTAVYSSQREVTLVYHLNGGSSFKPYAAGTASGTETVTVTENYNGTDETVVEVKFEEFDRSIDYSSDANKDRHYPNEDYPASTDNEGQAFRPFRSGYAFKKWNTKTDGSGENVETADTIRVNPLDADDKGTVHLYAVWEYIPFNVQITDNTSASDDSDVLYYNAGTSLRPDFQLAKFQSIDGARTQLGNLFKKNGENYEPYNAKSNTAYIEMLKNQYTLQKNDAVETTLGVEGEAEWTGGYKVVLTKKPTLSGTCTIVRGDDIAKKVGTITTQVPMFTVKNVDFTFKDITIDGNGGGASDGGIVKLDNSSAKVTLADGAVLQNGTAGSKGGAVYVDSGELIVQTGGKIQNCSAGEGSAVYVGGGVGGTKGKLTMTGGSITGNTSTSGGAVNFALSSDGLFLSGSPEIYGNTDSSGNQRNVDIHITAATTSNINSKIQVNGTLDESAHIGVYAPSGHDAENDRFGTYAGSAQDQFYVFSNDKNVALFGADGGSGALIWRYAICKIVDTNGVEHPFPTLNHALTYARANTFTTKINGTVTIQMLVDYTMPDWDTVSINSGENYTLTTAHTGTYKYADDENNAVITRGYTGASMISSSGNLTTTNIILDGGSKAAANGAETYSCTGNGGIINATAGTVTITNSELRNCNTTGDGGVIYLESGTMTISGSRIYDFKASGNGGAIYNNSVSKLTYTNTEGVEKNYTVKIDSSTIDGHEGGVANTQANAANGGAIYNKQGDLRIAGSRILDCKASVNGGAIYEDNTGSGNTDLDTINLYNVTIDGHAGGLDNSTANADKGGAVYIATKEKQAKTQGGSMRLKDCTILDCVASNEGGAIYNCSLRRDEVRNDETRDEPTVHMLHTTINGHESLPEGTPNAKRGGAIVLANGTLEIESDSLGDSAIINCIASNQGGAIDSYGSGTQFGDSAADDYTVKLKNVAIENCSATNGNGGAIMIKKILTMTDTHITDCAAGGQGGALFMRDDSDNDSRLNMSGGYISGNSSTSGGAVDVQGDDVRLNFSGAAVVYNNPTTGSGQKNVVLSVNSDAVINTVSPGLTGDAVTIDPDSGEATSVTPGAHIGVYVTGDMSPESDPYKTCGGFEDDFASYDTTKAASKNNPDCFTNDRNGMYGELSSTNGKFRWTAFICKITREDTGALLYYKVGSQVKGAAVFKTLQDAFSNLGNLYTDPACTTANKYNPSITTTNAGGETVPSNPVGIEMLEAVYELPKTTYVQANQNAYVTLTTAKKEGETGYIDDGHPYRGTAGTPAVIERGSCTTYMFHITGSMHLSVENITIDGENYQMTTDGALFHMHGGVLTMESDATLQNGVAYGASGCGGAVYINGANATFIMNDGTIQDCEAWRTSYYAGGAVCVNNGFMTMNGGTIQRCHAKGAGNGTACNGGAGGAVAVGHHESFSMTGGTIKDCTAIKSGGGVELHGDMHMSGGTITGCTSTYGGAVNFFQNDGNGTDHGRLFLSGSPTIYNNGTKDASGNITQQKNIDLTRFDDTHTAWNNVINKIHIEKTENHDGMSSTAKVGVYAPDAVVTGTATSNNPIHKDERGDDFGRYETGASTDNSEVFINDKDDTLTGNDLKQDGKIYWSGGQDVEFKKVDGFGEALLGAVFTLYSDQACTTSLGTDYVKTSSDGTDAFKYADGTTIIPKGNVFIEKVPMGFTYMKETTAPTKDPDGNAASYKLDTHTYIIIAGESLMTVPSETDRTDEWAGVLSNITQADINAQRGTQDASGKYERDYAIFQIDNETGSATNGKAIATPDIAAYGIMNESAAQKKVILRKVDGTSYASLKDAWFRIFTCDMKEVKNGDWKTESGNSGYKSLDSGVYFIDKLPFGKYYLVETVAPTTGRYDGNKGKVFVLEVKADGMTNTLSTNTTISVDPVNGADVVPANLKALVTTTP